MSIISSIEQEVKKDFDIVVHAVESGAVAVSQIVKTVIVGVADDTWIQAKKLFAQSHVGTFILNSIEAASVSGVDVTTKFDEIVTGAIALITELEGEGEGSALQGIEAELKAFVSALVSDAIASFEGNKAGSILLQLASKL